MKNLDLLYNKLFYKVTDHGITVDGARRDSLLDAKFSSGEVRDPMDEIAAYSGAYFRGFCMETVYPGMLIGAGAPHGVAGLDNDLMLGSSFDYTTGQPYLPGSSIKGVLRSHFKARPEAVAELLRAITGNARINADTVSRLETAVFEEDNVFFDAGPVSGDAEGYLLAEDYITPHPSPVEEPVPIPFLKVRSGVRFKFCFLLHDAAPEGPEPVTVTADQLQALFRELMGYFGVGAKTNVGYGALREAQSV